MSDVSGSSTGIRKGRTNATGESLQEKQGCTCSLLVLQLSISTSIKYQSNLYIQNMSVEMGNCLTRSSGSSYSHSLGDHKCSITLFLTGQLPLQSPPTIVRDYSHPMDVMINVKGDFPSSLMRLFTVKPPGVSMKIFPKSQGFNLKSHDHERLLTRTRLHSSPLFNFFFPLSKQNVFLVFLLKEKEGTKTSWERRLTARNS